MWGEAQGSLQIQQNASYRLQHYSCHSVVFPSLLLHKQGKQLWHQASPELVTQTTVGLLQQTDPDTKVCFAQLEKTKLGKAVIINV